MSQRLPLSGFTSVKKAAQFNEDFIKGYNEDIVQYSKELYELHNDLAFLLEENEN